MRKNITKQAFDEIQRLSGLNFTRKEIAKAVGCGISTVGAIRTAGTWENYEDFKKMQRERKHAKPNIENQYKYIETGVDRDLAIQCPKCGLYIPCDDYDKAKETHKFCYECGKKMF